MTDAAAIRREGDLILISLPIKEAHALRVALAPCPCKAAKSVDTECIRQRLAKALGKF